MKEIENFKLISGKNIPKDFPINKFIIPFSYYDEYGFNNLVNNLLETKSWNYIRMQSKENDLYKNINQLILYDSIKLKNQEGIGVSLNYCKKNLYPLVINKKEVVHFKEVNLVLFKMNIGFLILDIHYENISTLQDVIYLNYKLKHLSQNHFSSYEKNVYKIDQLTIYDTQMKDYIKVLYNRKIKYIDQSLPINELDDIPILANNKNGNYSLITKTYKEENINTIISSILEGIKINYYFNESHLGNSLKKAVLFTSCVIEQDFDNENIDNYNQLLKYFYLLRKGYKESYHPTKSDVILEFNESIYQPFENVIFGISREGLGNLAIISSNVETNNFITNNYITRIENYFYLYIIILHQYYGLLYLMHETSRLPNDICLYDQVNKNILNQLKQKINLFQLKSIYEEVSFITHQANFYSRIIKIYNIKNMLNELGNEVVSITNLLDQIHDQHKKEIEIKTDKRWKKFTIVGALFTYIATMQAVLCIWEYLAHYKMAIKGNELIFAFMSTTLLSIIAYIIISLLSSKNNNE